MAIDNTQKKSAPLTEVRTEIDKVDAEILNLLAQRRDLAKQVVEVKDETNGALRDPSREAQLLRQRIVDGRELGLDAQYVTGVFHQVIAEAVRTQQDHLQTKVNGSSLLGAGTSIAFHGIEGSFCHLAGRSFIASSKTTAGAPTFVGFPTYADAVRAVEHGTCAYGILPIENTTSGGNNEVYDLLLNSRVSIVGEEKVRVRPCLVGANGASLSHLERVYADPTSVSECSTFLASLPECRVEFVSDAALGVKRVHESGNRLHAAIASEEAAEMFGLSVLKGDIANQEESFTRFLVIAKQPRKVDGRIPSKTAIVIHTLNKAGALVEALNVFKERGINLTKLESRPIPGNSWEEMFYIDFLGNLESDLVKTALGDLTKLVRFIKVLGCFPACDVEPTVVETSPEATKSEAASEGASCARIEVKEPQAPKAAPGKDKGYKLVTREHKESNTVIDVGGVKIGDGNFLVIAGPCSVESRDQIMSCAKEARNNGARILRGGVFKPRTSPYSFQGLGYEGLDLLVEAGQAFGMPVITEVMTTEDVERVAEKADIIQIGARNMQNFSLLKAVGQIRRPVMLKRGMSSSIEEVLQATEYILAGGNQQVFLCERGIRTFETATRGTLDISAVPVLKKRTHLPIFIDPSHAAGVRELVTPLALAAKAVGADGIIVEFHPEPEKALSDGPQALRYPQFEKLMQDLKKIQV
jgi:chorismate mutase/prephenate dehydratase